MMKKSLLISLAVLFVASLGGIVSANSSLNGWTESYINNLSTSAMGSMSCDEVHYTQVYKGYGGVLVDYFTNTSAGDDYIWNYASHTYGSHFLYNPSHNPANGNNGIMIFNRNKLSAAGWKVKAGHTVRAMTTAEEVGGSANFSFAWSMGSPITSSISNDFGSYTFHTPNRRNDGTTPVTPSIGSAYDAEVRLVLAYDGDNNDTTTSDNRGVLECERLQVRRCGDGILDTSHGEACDHGLANGTPGDTCSATCTPVILPPSPPDVTVVKSEAGSHIQGQNISYTITYNNIGSGMADNTVITDTLGAGLTFLASSSVPAATSITPNVDGTTTIKRTIGSLSAHAGGTIKFNAQIKTTVPNCSTVKNHVHISATNELGPDTLNNDYDVTWPIQCPSNPQIWIQKDVVASTGGYAPNGYAIYTITYGNSGSGTATGVVVTDTLPGDVIFSSAIPAPSSVVGQALTWNIGTLAPGQSGTIKIIVKIKTTVPVCQDYIVLNKGVIKATGLPPVEDDATFLVLCYDLYANKVIDKPIVASGDIVTYTIRYGNFGPLLAPNRSLVDSLPAGLQYVSGSIVILSGVNIGYPTVTATPTTGQVLTWTGFTNMAAGYSGLVSLKALVLGPTTSGHVYLNTVCVVGDSNYNNNNCGTAVTTVTGTTTTGSGPFFDLNLSKSVDKATADNGETVTFTLTVMNESDVTAPVNGYTVQDYLPGGIDYLGNPTGPSGMVVTLSGTKDIIFSALPNLNPGDRFTITFQGTYKSTVTETNYAEICSYIGMSAVSGIKDRDSNPCNRGRATAVEDDESQASVGPKTTKTGCQYCGSTSGPYCGDGVVRVGEQCDPGNALLGIKPAGVPAGKVCRPDCTYGEQPPGMSAQVKCAYVDPPAINVGEYMPYRWDMEYGYNITGGGLKLATSYCTTATGDIRLNKNTVVCEFTLTGPNGAKKSWQQPCYTNPHLPLIDTAFESARLRYNMDIFPGGFDSIPMTLTGGYYLGLGEYMIEMRAVSGRECNGTAVTVPDRVCQMNFGVTKQYAITRTPRGDGTSTPDLPTYKRQDKTPVLQISDLLKPLQPFTLSSADKNVILQMANKYVNLSVKADTITDKLDNNTTIVKAIVSKVPGKNIFVIDAKTPMGGKGLITVMDNTTYQGGAFTLIVINGDLVVKGNLQKNPNGMFIVRDGDLTFSAIGDAKENNQDQLVKGIFIGLNNVKAEGDNQPAFNNNLNKPWINGGRLTLDGIILGGDLTKMVEGRRSIVEDRFYKRAGDGLLTDGSLVIQANPDIFTNLPPGAEDISVTLNVFKK